MIVATETMLATQLRLVTLLDGLRPIRSREEMSHYFSQHSGQNLFGWAFPVTVIKKRNGEDELNHTFFTSSHT